MLFHLNVIEKHVKKKNKRNSIHFFCCWFEKTTIVTIILPPLPHAFLLHFFFVYASHYFFYMLMRSLTCGCGIDPTPMRELVASATVVQFSSAKECGRRGHFSMLCGSWYTIRLSDKWFQNSFPLANHNCPIATCVMLIVSPPSHPVSVQHWFWSFAKTNFHRCAH